MAKSIHHARVLIRQRHIRDDKKENYICINFTDGHGFVSLATSSSRISNFVTAISLLVPFMTNISYTAARRQVVNVLSFMVRVDSQKHIDFFLVSPFGGGSPGRVKRKNQKAAAKKASGGDRDEDDEE